MNTRYDLILSAVSHQVVLGIFDGKSAKLLNSCTWATDQNTSLSQTLEANLKKLLLEGSLSTSQIQRLLLISGPGAFTGLRVGAAFFQGFAQALKIPLIGIPTFELFQKSFWIPLRQQLCLGLNLEECLSRKLEFLHIQSPTDYTVSTPVSSGDFILGCKDSNPLWPSIENLEFAYKNFISGQATFSQPLKIDYGSEPKLTHPSSRS